jgi:hypothetical protein
MLPVLPCNVQRVIMSVRPEIETVGMLRSRLADTVFSCDVSRVRIAHLSADDDILVSEDVDKVPISGSGLRVAFSGAILPGPAADTRNSVFLPYSERVRQQVCGVESNVMELALPSVTCLPYSLCISGTSEGS